MSKLQILAACGYDRDFTQRAESFLVDEIRAGIQAEVAYRNLKLFIATRGFQR